MRDRFRRRTNTPRTKAHASPDVQLDPVAISLAIWLAIVVAVTGFIRVTQDALAQARAAQATAAGKMVSASQAGTLGIPPETFGVAPIGG